MASRQAVAKLGWNPARSWLTRTVPEIWPQTCAERRRIPDVLLWESSRAKILRGLRSKPYTLHPVRPAGSQTHKESAPSKPCEERVWPSGVEGPSTPRRNFEQLPTWAGSTLMRSREPSRFVFQLHGSTVPRWLSVRSRALASMKCSSRS